ncbi:MAG: nucleotidyltransferase family protein [Methylococcus sp.]|nr:nucleotidyltransferase family protein [Methylococcus sp.]
MTRWRDLALLRFLCQCLSPGQGASPALIAEIERGEIPWPALLRFAGNHWVTPALAGALQRKAMFERLPAEIQEYLDALQSLNRARNRTLCGELSNIASLLNRRGIEPVLLKGACALLPGAYPGAEDRVIGDLDILIPAGSIETAVEDIVRSGYEPYAPDEPVLAEGMEHHHHAPPLLHPKLPVKVELHHRLLADEADAAHLQARMTTNSVELPGGNVRVRVPDPATRLLHNFLHTQIQDHHHVRRSIDLRQLLDFAALAGHHANTWDGAASFARLTAKRRRPFAVYLAVAEDWLGLAYPAEAYRPKGVPLQCALIERVETSRRWRRLVALYAWPQIHLPRLRNLPRKLAKPGWCAAKLRALRRGEPL